MPIFNVQLIKWGSGLLIRDGSIATDTECCCCDCCGWNEEEGGPKLTNFEISYPSLYSSATEGTVVDLPVLGSGSSDCKREESSRPGTARIDFEIFWSDGGCLASDTKPAYAELYHKPPFPGAPNGCCYWKIYMEQPDSPCMGSGNLGDNWPGGLLIQANCQGRGLITCDAWVTTQSALGNACATTDHCDDGGYVNIDFATNLLTDCYCRENEFAV